MTSRATWFCRCARRPLPGPSAVLALTALILVVALASMAETAAAVSIQTAPGCQGAPADPEIGDLCPDGSIPDEFSATVSGDIGSGATVTIDPSVPPCSEQDSGTDVFTPDGCYSGMDFNVGTPLCAYLDSYDDGVNRPPTHEGKPAYDCDSYLLDEPLPGTLIYTDKGNSNYYLGLSDDDCSAAFNTLYASGGPPGDTWPTHGPASLTCTYQRPAHAPNGQDTEPNGLYGPTWIQGTVTLHIEYSDGTSAAPGTLFWIPVDGTERARPPIARFEENKTATQATYDFLNHSVSQKGHAMSYKWTFEAAAVGDSGYTKLGTSGAQQPEFNFDYGKYAHVTLDITDSVNGMTDTVVHGFTIDRSGAPPPPGGDLPVVTVEASDDSAAEAGHDTGTWTLTRTKTAGKLTVNVSTSGTASEGSDYLAVADTATFPAGKDTVDVTLTPVSAPPVESAEVATMTVDPGDGYTVGDPSTGDITILSDDGSVSNPELKAKRTQKQKGKAILVKGKASAGEPVKVVLTGKVKVGKKSYPLAKQKSKESKTSTAFKLRPKGKKAKKKIAKYLKKGKKAKAKIKADFSDDSGNKATKRKNVKLKGKKKR